jgi:hypothetical protein
MRKIYLRYDLATVYLFLTKRFPTRAILTLAVLSLSVISTGCGGLKTDGNGKTDLSVVSTTSVAIQGSAFGDFFSAGYGSATLINQRTMSIQLGDSVRTTCGDTRKQDSKMIILSLPQRKGTFSSDGPIDEIAASLINLTTGLQNRFSKYNISIEEVTTVSIRGRIELLGVSGEMISGKFNIPVCSRL